MEEVSHFECAGAGVFARVSGEAWFHREWGYLDLLRPDVEDGYVALCFFRCRLCTWQRCGSWRCSLLLLCVLLWSLSMQFAMLVVLIDGLLSRRPLELETDGDLLVFLFRVWLRGSWFESRVIKFMAHSDEGMVRCGEVREMDRVGNDSAYEAAGF